MANPREKISDAKQQRTVYAELAARLCDSDTRFLRLGLILAPGAWLTKI